ncbi:hypothetical protein PSAC2689_10311 [Paraburkholderia sacchari]
MRIAMKSRFDIRQIMVNMAINFYYLNSPKIF